jgi:hypothetical protein
MRAGARRTQANPDLIVKPFEVARHVVISTNRWPGLRTLYDRAYDLGLSFAVYRLASVPGVVAVLLRTNDEGPAWVPGFSDYDLTVLHEADDPSRTIRFLDNLWARYRAIKRTVPQLGEMEVLSVEDYGDFLDFGPMPTASLKRAHTVFVKNGHANVRRVLERERRPSQPQEVLLDALSRNGRFAVPACIEAERSGNRATRRRAEHLLANVEKRLDRLGLSREAHPRDGLLGRLVRVFQALTEASAAVPRRESDPKPVVFRGGMRIATESVCAIRDVCERSLRDAGLSRSSAVLWTAYMSGDGWTLTFIVPDDTPAEQLERLLVTFGQVNHAIDGLRRRSSPLIAGLAPPLENSTFLATESIWRCWRELAPFDGVAVAASGHTLVGHSAVSEDLPSLSGLRRGAEVQYVTLLPLMNNWRLAMGRPSGAAYRPLVNHARGYESAFGVEVSTSPAALHFESMEEGYRAAVDAMNALRTTVRSSISTRGGQG